MMSDVPSIHYIKNSYLKVFLFSMNTQQLSSEMSYHLDILAKNKHREELSLELKKKIIKILDEVLINN